ncbi:hypothetical protein ABVK25_011983 [Lepraria finkii]|uniref:Uncharacterized protein n=1 Tax=Lepraria finkii TaxID=1340010 RepID=A0ABR4AK91_9LECA
MTAVCNPTSFLIRRSRSSNSTSEQTPPRSTFIRRDQVYADTLTRTLRNEDDVYEEEMRSLRDRGETVSQSQAGKGQQRDKSGKHSQTTSENVLNLQTMREGYHEDLRQTYEQGVTELARLAGSGKTTSTSTSASGSAAGTSAGAAGASMTLTETVGKVQRARTVAMEFE